MKLNHYIGWEILALVLIAAWAILRPTPPPEAVAAAKAIVSLLSEAVEALIGMLLAAL